MFDYEKYGDAVASTECPKCGEKPLIVKVWPKTENKYQVICHVCSRTLGRHEQTKWGPIWKPCEFDSIEAADQEWSERVRSNSIDF